MQSSDDILLSCQSIFNERHMYTTWTSQNTSYNIIKYITKFYDLLKKRCFGYQSSAEYRHRLLHWKIVASSDPTTYLVIAHVSLICTSMSHSTPKSENLTSFSRGVFSSEC